MKYYSTRDVSLRMTAAEAIKMGLSRDGGLLTPAEFPQLSQADLCNMCIMDYPHRAAYVMKLFLEDYSQEELLSYAQTAYGDDRFDTPLAAPLRKVDDDTFCLELWHGPTSAFKDMALQMLPHLLSIRDIQTENNPSETEFQA